MISGKAAKCIVNRILWTFKYLLPLYITLHHNVLNCSMPMARNFLMSDFSHSIIFEVGLLYN